mmetsp:Transcript_1520/g.2364  ORF Transcript_1520/g.2364 Transcript_1520/m.2364 type:complete len:210 (+) Transcript_1520:142-771(+)
MDWVMRRYSWKVTIKINHCRRYLQLVTISDLFLHDGKRFHPDLYGGVRASGRLAQYAWPDISPPSKSCWVVWKQFLRSEFPQRAHPNAADDVWRGLQSYSHDLQYRFDEDTRSLYRGDGDRWWKHEQLRAPSLRGVIAKFSLQSTIYDGDPPESSGWVDVEITKVAIVVLSESLRSAAVVRQLGLDEDNADPTTAVCLEARIRMLPPEL